MSASGDILRWDDLTDTQRRSLQVMCEHSFSWFLRIYFALVQGQRFILNWHHLWFCGLAEEIIEGQHKR